MYDIFSFHEIFVSTVKSSRIAIPLLSRTCTSVWCAVKRVTECYLSLQVIGSRFGVLFVRNCGHLLPPLYLHRTVCCGTQLADDV